MGLPLIGPLTQVGEQVSRDISSGANSFSHMLTSGWGAGLALLVLTPFIGIFVRPALRVAGALTNSAAAIISAMLVCVSSWIVLVTQHITVLGHALRPTPRMLPFFRLAALVGIASFLVHYYSIPVGYLVGAGIASLACWMLYASKFLARARSIDGLRSKKAVAVIVVVVMIVGIASVTARSLWRSSKPVTACLVHGEIKQDCVTSLQAQRF